MNALVGLCRPADFGADVCHLTFSDRGAAVNYPFGVTVASQKSKSKMRAIYVSRCATRGELKKRKFMHYCSLRRPDCCC
jgi:hypothetical protein